MVNRVNIKNLSSYNVKRKFSKNANEVIWELIILWVFFVH